MLSCWRLNRFSIFVFLVFSFSFFVVGLSAAVAEIRCEQVVNVEKLSEVTASAGKWSNFRKKPGSLRFESEKILKEAEDRLAKITPPSAFECPSNCRLNPQPKIVIETIPTKFRVRYQDERRCAEYLQRTENTPFIYPQRRFSDEKEFSDWFLDFSRGNGADGDDLYEKCDGECSPRYTSFITANAKGIEADIKVICGPARDKSDNRYRLVSSFHWSCEPL